ncbi:MAG: hypothetical protein II297_09140 [Clostridia bacterium]|nr:hypothetical protein [Clostridia bacterium]
MLKVPANYGKLLDAFGRGETAQDYRNDQAILKLFCDTYAAFSKKKREDFEVVLNSGVARTDTFADLVTLALQMHKYYRLKGVASKERLGRMHILSAQANHLDNRVAKSPIGNAREVGADIQKEEGGRFYNGDYVGVYTCFNDTDE